MRVREVYSLFFLYGRCALSAPPMPDMSGMDAGIDGADLVSVDVAVSDL